MVNVEFKSRYSDAGAWTHGHCITKACFVNPHVQKWVFLCDGSEHTQALDPDCAGSIPHPAPQWLRERSPESGSPQLLLPSLEVAMGGARPRAPVRTESVNAGKGFTVALGTCCVTHPVKCTLATSSLSEVLSSLVPQAGHAAWPQPRSVAGRGVAPTRPMPWPLEAGNRCLAAAGGASSCD